MEGGHDGLGCGDRGCGPDGDDAGSDFPTRHNYTLALWKNEIERLWADWVAGLPVTILRSCEVTAFTEDGDRARPRDRGRADAGRSECRLDRRLRQRPWPAQPDMDRPVQRSGAAGHGLTAGPGIAGGGCGACACATWRARAEHRGSGCGQSGVEAGADGARSGAGQPAGQLSCRAASRATWWRGFCAMTDRGGRWWA